MPFPPETLIVAAFVVAAGYTVFGLTGFGASITAMPVLLLLFPLHFAVPLMLIFDLCAGLLLGVNNRGAVDRGELLRMAPFMLAGMVVGVTVLVNAPERVLLSLLGVFVLTYASWNLLFRRELRPLRAFWAVPFSAIGGVFTALFGTGGPIYTIYLARRITDTASLRATIGTLIFISGVARLALFTGAGLYNQSGVLSAAMLLLPCALIGLYLGSRLHHRLPAHRVVQVVWIILIGGGASLVWRGVFG